jgi:TonB family protein
MCTKRILLVTLIITGISQIHAFAQDTTYFNASWKVSTADQASYFRKKVKTDSGWQVTDCFISGKPQMAGFYTDDSCKVSQGEFTWYDDKGNLYHRCSYVQGKAEGRETLYYPGNPGGHKRTEGMNKADKHTGDWTGYYPSGKLSARVRFKDGNQSSASFFNEDGTANKNITLFSREANYPGGMPAYLRFLNKTFRYPDTAVNYEIQGTVLVGFNISREGNISDIKIVRSVEASLDAEALRVVRLMPAWEYLIIGGIACDSYHTQPIIFKLEN